MKTTEVQEYKIHFEETVAHSEALKNFFEVKKYRVVFILVDEHTKIFCLPKILNQISNAQIEVLEISSGEKEKNLITCQNLWNQLIEKNADRKCLFMNLGGGVICDMGGFVASTFKRGIDFMHVPTTLLSQVDASVGGKLAIDLNGVKNIIGVFKNPIEIFVFSDLLQTLPFRELRSGFAEILKHGLIKDAQLWSDVKNISIKDVNDWSDIVFRNVEIKKNVVTQDFFEFGERKILNFGHTIGHAIETFSLLTDQDPLLHGEAIAIGMICEAWLSSEYTQLHPNKFNEIVEVLSAFYPKYIIEPKNFDSMVQYMFQDKKNFDQQIQFSLLNDIGNCLYNIPIDRQPIIDALYFYKQST